MVEFVSNVVLLCYQLVLIYIVYDFVDFVDFVDFLS